MNIQHYNKTDRTFTPLEEYLKEELGEGYCSTFVFRVKTTNPNFYDRLYKEIHAIADLKEGEKNSYAYKAFDSVSQDIKKELQEGNFTGVEGSAVLSERYNLKV